MEKDLPGKPKFPFFLASIFVFFALIAIFWTQLNARRNLQSVSRPKSISSPAIDNSRSIFQFQREQALSSTGKFPQEEIFAKVGEENLYGRDLNYKLFIYYPEVLKSGGEVPLDIEEEIANKLVYDSLILQEAAKRGLVSLNNTIFNNLDKDYPQRNKLVNEAKEKLENQVVDQIDGEAIYIWFYNGKIPSMGLEAAKEVTRKKIENLYQEIKQGTLTFKQAGEKISADSELAAIDPAYQANAYQSIKGAQKNRPPFVDQNLDKALWALGEDEISPILTGIDSHTNSEVFYAVIKVNQRIASGYDNFEDWLLAEKKQYEIKFY